MITPRFDDDRRYCAACTDYVRFLQSPSASYCTDCGGVVTIFSPEDMESLQSSLRADKGFVARQGPRGEGDPRAVS